MNLVFFETINGRTLAVNPLHVVVCWEKADVTIIHLTVGKPITVKGKIDDVQEELERLGTIAVSQVAD